MGKRAFLVLANYDDLPHGFVVINRVACFEFSCIGRAIKALTESVDWCVSNCDNYFGVVAGNA